MSYPTYVDKTINITSLRSFIGMVKYLRRYIKDCAKLCSVLNQLLCNDSDHAIWKQEHQGAWGALVKALVGNVGIHHPNYHYPVYVCTDGSKVGVGGCLYQIIDGEEKIVSFYSRSTTKAERKWDTRDLEVLAIIATLEHYRPAIDGQRPEEIVFVCVVSGPKLRVTERSIRCSLAPIPPGARQDRDFPTTTRVLFTGHRQLGR